MTYNGVVFLADATVFAFLVLAFYFMVRHWKDE